MMFVSSKNLHHHLSSSLSSRDSDTKQGIVTILGSDSQTNKSASIRRTISADMSSRKWVSQNGFFFQMKRADVVTSPDHSSFSSEPEEEEEYDRKAPGQDEVWNSIQSKKERNEIRKPVDVCWGSILTQKSENPCDLPPVYIHPLVKSSASTLSEKSLEICTESLGSETGSDGFSSLDALSDDAGEDDKQDGQREDDQFKEWISSGDFHVPKYKKCPLRPLPPPLRSIAGGDGVSLHMQSHRGNGRLVLEAVSVAPRNNFYAQRRDGRLVLSLINSPALENEVDEFEGVFDKVDVEEKLDDGGGNGGYEVDMEAEEKEKEVKFVMEHQLRTLPSRMMRGHKSALVTKNPAWSNKFNEVVNLSTKPIGGGLVSFNSGLRSVEADEDDLPILQSLPSPPPLARLIPPHPAPTVVSFNAYEYFWRNKTPSFNSFINPRLKHLKSNVISSNKFSEHHDMVLVKGDEPENVVPYLKGCKERRRALLIGELCSIATS